MIRLAAGGDCDVILVEKNDDRELKACTGRARQLTHVMHLQRHANLLKLAATHKDTSS